MQARERRDALKRLVGAITSSRPWAFLASSHLARRIRHSLSARLAVAITLAVLVIVLVSGVIIASQLRTSMFETRRDAILADASLRFSSAQSVFSSSTASSPAQVQESARGALASLKASAAGAGATNVALLRSEGTAASLRINQIEDEQMRGLVTAQMRAAVAGGGAQWQSVAIRSSDGKKEEPGILVGTQVQLPRAARTSFTFCIRCPPTKLRSMSFCGFCSCPPCRSSSPCRSAYLRSSIACSCPCA